MTVGLAAAAAWADPAGLTAVFEKRAEQNYAEARARFHRQITNAEAAWQLGRACFDRAELAPEKDKETFANEGAYACRQGLIDNPKSAWAHYYLGLNLGELASSRGLGALSLLHDMRSEWETAGRLDPAIDYAGPERSLGMLYRDAPGWPLSIGSRGKAIESLTRAVHLSPNYPDNWLTLVEAYLKWNEHRQASLLAVSIPKVIAQARHEFAGPAWESSWVDWDSRWAAIQTRLGGPGRPHSPHER